jgi:hypothetical protein
VRLPIVSAEADAALAVRFDEKVVSIVGAATSASAEAFAELLADALGARGCHASVVAGGAVEPCLTVILTDGLPPASWQKSARDARDQAALELAEPRPGVADGLAARLVG